MGDSIYTEPNTSYTISLYGADPGRWVADTVDGNLSANMSSETNDSTSQEYKDIKNGVKGNVVEDPLKKCRQFPKRVTETDEYTEKLFKMLSSNQEGEFIEFITDLEIEERKSANLNCYNGIHTYLQYACMRGLDIVAKYLIHSKADPCAVGGSNDMPSLFLAIYYEHYSIAKYIIESDSNQLFMHYDGYNIIHMMVITEEAHSDDYLCFLKYLFGKITHLYKNDLKKEARYLLDEEDSCRKTPLNLAIERGSYHIVFDLLERVDILKRNEYGDCGLLDMDPSVFETYLNRKVNQCTNPSYLENKNYICFNYTTFVPPECFEKDNVSEETSRIVYLSELPDFRHLINHPVVSIFIHLKWQKVKWLFYFNILVYFTFCLLFTQYILLHKESQTGYLIILVTICLFILIIREILQIYISRLGYLRQLDNWIEIPLIVTTLLTMFSNTSMHQELSAVAIFLTWTELILLIGRHPIVSTKVEMYKRVSLNFFNFLSFYFLFVVAFALSFYILSRDTNPEHSSVSQTFSNVTITIYDTLVRFVDLKPETLPIEDHPVVGRAFLLMYLLLIAVIMLNLLNGLAVSDTKAIIDEAKVFGHISRLKLICSVENFAKILGSNFMKRFKLFHFPVTSVEGLSTKDLMINIDGNLFGPFSFIEPSDLIKAKQILRKSYRDPIESNVRKLLRRDDLIQNKLVQIDDKVKIVIDKMKPCLVE